MERYCIVSCIYCTVSETGMLSSLSAHCTRTSFYKHALITVELNPLASHRFVTLSSSRLPFFPSLSISVADIMA